MRGSAALPRHLTPRSADWLRRALLTMALGLVALSVIGMHQLSSGHSFAAPAVATQQHAAAGHAHAEAHVGDLAPRSGGAHDTKASAEAWGPAEVSAGSSGGLLVDGDGCAGCASHTAFTVCLLALTLLMMSWWLAPPRVRPLPPQPRRLPNTVATVVSRQVPPLSLGELCILRT